MAVTTIYKKQEEQYKPQASQYPSQGYTGLAGVSDNTAKQLGRYQNGYNPSQTVTNAQQQMQQVQAQKPQGYNSKYGPMLDSMIQQIQNPKQFKYSFNGDEMFKNYADVFSQNARQASMDAMGQAAAMTGGYGNSYAQQVGNQAYNETMRPLYDIGMQLQQNAYQQYRDEQADLLNRYGVISGEEEKGYNRYQDEVANWLNERNYATDVYNTEADRDYNRFANDREFLQGLAKIENADYRNEQERQEAIRQYEQDYILRQRAADLQENELGWRMSTDERDYNRGVLESDRNYNEQVRQADLDEAYRQAQLAEQVRGTNLDEAYRRDTLAEQIRGNNLDEAYRQAQLAEQIRGTDLDESYRRDTLAEQKRQADLDELYRQNTLDWQKETDQRDYDRGVTESDRAYYEQVKQADQDEAYRRDQLAEQIRQADLDEAYRQNTLQWQKDTDARDYKRNVLESNRAYKRDVLESDRAYNRGVLESDRNYNEQVRQADLDEAYRRDQLSENIREFDASLNWDKMSSEQKYAAQYAMEILANGQMPSAELLKAAGLSEADAQKMMAKLSTGGGTPVDNGSTYYVDKNGKFYYYDKDGNARSVNPDAIKDTDKIDKSENTGTKGAQAEINDKNRTDNDKLKKHYGG